MNETCERPSRALGDTTVAAGCAMSPESNGCDRAPTITATVEISADRMFCDALRCVVHGQRITRKGWNGPNQHVSAQYPDKHSKMTAPYLVLRNAQGDLVPWVPSQGDLFARDWAILPIQPI